jgi:hypothetical protein
MSEEKKTWNSENFDKKMHDAHDELQALRGELQDLMVKFGMRALRLYQAARNEPLRTSEVRYLVKYEVTNAIADVSEKSSIEAIVEQAKQEWEKQHQQK